MGKKCGAMLYSTAIRHIYIYTARYSAGSRVGFLIFEKWGFKVSDFRVSVAKLTWRVRCFGDRSCNVGVSRDLTLRISAVRRR